MITEDEKISIKNDIASLSGDERDWFKDALRVLYPKNESSVTSQWEAKKDILFLKSLGKAWLNYEMPSQANTQGQLDDILAAARVLKKRLDHSHTKTKAIIGRFFPRASKQSGQERLDALSSQLAEIVIAAEKASKDFEAHSTKGEFLTSGLSAQDEFVAFCVSYFEKHRPNVAAKSETNPVHDFCKTMVSLATGEFREASLMGSINKRL